MDDWFNIFKFIETQYSILIYLHFYQNNLYPHIRFNIPETLPSHSAFLSGFSKKKSKITLLILLQTC